MRTRRLCEVKPSGKTLVDDDVRTQYKQGGENRELLEMALLESIAKYGVARSSCKRIKAWQTSMFFYGTCMAILCHFQNHAIRIYLPCRETSSKNVVWSGSDLIPVKRKRWVSGWLKMPWNALAIIRPRASRASPITAGSSRSRCAGHQCWKMIYIYIYNIIIYKIRFDYMSNNPHWSYGESIVYSPWNYLPLYPWSLGGIGATIYRWRNFMSSLMTTRGRSIRTPHVKWTKLIWVNLGIIYQIRCWYIPINLYIIYHDRFDHVILEVTPSFISIQTIYLCAQDACIPGQEVEGCSCWLAIQPSESPQGWTVSRGGGFQGQGLGLSCAPSWNQTVHG